MLEQLIEAWQTNHRVTLKLLKALSDEALQATLSTRGGRDVARQLAHVHEVRTSWAEISSRTNRDAKLPHFAKGESPSNQELQAALEASADGIETTIRESLAKGGKVTSFKRGLIPLISYLIAHESHHRGQIALSLKQAGKPLDKKIGYGIWEWGVR